MFFRIKKVLEILNLTSNAMLRSKIHILLFLQMYKFLCAICVKKCFFLPLYLIKSFNDIFWKIFVLNSNTTKKNHATCKSKKNKNNYY